MKIIIPLQTEEIDNLKRRLVTYLCIFLAGTLFARAQEVISPEGTVLPDDSVYVTVGDTIAADTIPARKSPLEAPVIYSAKDSIVMTAGNMAYLFGEANVKYQNIELQSEAIDIDMDSSQVYAKFAVDSIGDEFGYPLFSQGDQQYEGKTMRYNFKTRKGYITHVVTQQGEGYVIADRTKKTETDALNMVGGKYTTCDHHDHPHFYIQMTKAKVRPNKDIVTGPVYLVIEDVPLPVALPFAFFPFTSEYSSGIIMPSYGDESKRGFNLHDGGYYFALSDYVDLALTGDIYTKGSWRVNARSTYRKRYKFSGNFDLSYAVNVEGDKGMPDYTKSKDFSIKWSHTQDAKMNPFRSFSASVNFATSSYHRNEIGSFYPGSNGYSDASQNNKGSTINLTQRFPNSPFTVAATFSVNQQTRDSMLAVTLPDISITMSRIYPFKRKNAVGKERWYEKISMSYSGYMRNTINTKEYLLMESSLLKDWKNGMKHNIPVSANFNVFNYINISPSFNYTERWYTSKITETYDPIAQKMAPADTTMGFYRLYDFNASLSASTTIYGDFTPVAFLKKLTGIQMIRHRLEPSVSVSYRPDFGDPLFGFMERYSYVNNQGEEQIYEYSPFRHGIYGVPPTGKSGMVSFSLDNNLEMKVASKNDSIAEKKVSLIDKFSLTGFGYNMAVDSFKWSQSFNANLRIKFGKAYTLNLNMTFDTYMNEAIRDSEGNVTGLRKVDKLRVMNGRGLGRLQRTGTSFNYTFNNDTFKKLFGGKKDSSKGESGGDSQQGDGMTSPDQLGGEPGMEGGDQQGGGRLLGKKQEVGERDADGYLITQIPWSFTINYSMNLGYDTQKIDEKRLEYKYGLTHNLTFNGNIQPTKNWRFNFNATYNFDAKKITNLSCNITRDLHCFQMSASFMPVGPYKSYSFSIAVSSSLLKDLKYNQSSNYRDAQQWY
ncbi:lipopolysaccharide assembly outer membrane protein LptD (OstA) [Parabacteroides sp. PFB2-12]|uniref:putative LPS assembly protein LptD n=1 Tax=unclassified Parabacteroides TaxID=2649774 RepID=UPI0024763F31|nr:MULTISPECIES: putative LPS assembly protein LptD [unclassified Parabacteroides]MDH6343896.1 lipopolysaccharide assembly outer membrane protein LptD (OstA) [Parabacteroides sp. PM6-13]MDH6391258.1 lipopolysaccharide assembly outer membrane protein LptD (OstA) [Parabacteroides sp. PFB2-12]